MRFSATPSRQATSTPVADLTGNSTVNWGGMPVCLVGRIKENLQVVVRDSISCCVGKPRNVRCPKLKVAHCTEKLDAPQ